MRRIRLLHVNLVLYGILLVVVVLFRGELAWAVRALPAEILRSAPPTHPQWELYHDAKYALETEGQARRAAQLLERAIEIEPLIDFQHLLGTAYLWERDFERALATFRRCHEMDPSYLPAYQRMAEILAAEGRDEERERLLQKGIEHFARGVERFAPRPDETVDERYNQKAHAVRERYREGERTLRRLVAETIRRRDRAGPVPTPEAPDRPGR